MNCVEAERDLYERMRRCAKIELGPNGTEDEIKKLADRYYWNDGARDWTNRPAETAEEKEAYSRRVSLEAERILKEEGPIW